ncbi:hypothetical protein V490_03875, partial [Pseudogymnoascus sp. VKM F-3557]
MPSRDPTLIPNTVPRIRLARPLPVPLALINARIQTPPMLLQTRQEPQKQQPRAHSLHPTRYPRISIDLKLIRPQRPILPHLLLQQPHRLQHLPHRSRQHIIRANQTQAVRLIKANRDPVRRRRRRLLLPKHNAIAVEVRENLAHHDTGGD